MLLEKQGMVEGLSIENLSKFALCISNCINSVSIRDRD